MNTDQKNDDLPETVWVRFIPTQNGRVPREAYTHGSEIDGLVKFTRAQPVASTPCEGERPCETCKGDPLVCAEVPGSRHCEAASRQPAADNRGDVEKYHQLRQALFQMGAGVIDDPLETTRWIKLAYDNLIQQRQLQTRTTPEAGTVDVDLEVMRKTFDDEDLKYNDEVSRIAEAEIRGWNACIDELLRRGMSLEQPPRGFKDTKGDVSAEEASGAVAWLEIVLDGAVVGGPKPGDPFSEIIIRALSQIAKRGV